jgi:hypothetical protein
MPGKCLFVSLKALVFSLADSDYCPYIREVFHILLTMPIGSVPCERSSFSALSRLKQWNRTTLVEDRLNGLALLHIHRDVNVDRIQILDTFATGNRRIDGLHLQITSLTFEASTLTITPRMNRNYDGCTDEYALAQNLLMEKENKL